MRSVSGSRRFVGDIRCIFMVTELGRIHITGWMFMHMTALVDVLRRTFAKPMNVHKAQTMGLTSKTSCRPQPVRKREGDARRKHAKRVDQGEQPPCLQSLRSRQRQKHSVLCLNISQIRTCGAESLRGNAFAAKCNLSLWKTFRGVAQTGCGADDRHQSPKLFPLLPFDAGCWMAARFSAPLAGL